MRGIPYSHGHSGRWAPRHADHYAFQVFCMVPGPGSQPFCPAESTPLTRFVSGIDHPPCWLHTPILPNKFYLVAIGRLLWLPLWPPLGIHNGVKSSLFPLDARVQVVRYRQGHPARIHCCHFLGNMPRTTSVIIMETLYVIFPRAWIIFNRTHIKRIWDEFGLLTADS